MTFSSTLLHPKLSAENRKVLCVVVFIFCCACCIGVGLGVGYGFQVRNFKGASSEIEGSRTVFLEAELISVDPLTSTMVMNWYIVQDSCVPANTTCEPVNIYLDNNLLRHDNINQQETNDPRVNPSIFVWFPNETRAYSSRSTFRTTSYLFNSQRNDLDPSTLQSYPFDAYEAELLMYGNGTETNKSISITVDFTEGIAVGFKSSAIVRNSLGEDDTNAAVYYSDIFLTRSGLVKTYVLTIVVGVWLVTLAFVGVVIKIIFRYEQAKEVLVIPVATLFAFTTLRGTMPGAPNGFGAIIDYIGILPCLAVLTFASVILLAYLIITGGNLEYSARKSQDSFIEETHEVTGTSVV